MSESLDQSSPEVDLVRIARGFPDIKPLGQVEEEANDLGVALSRQHNEELALRRSLILAGAPISRGAVDLLSIKLASREPLLKRILEFSDGK